jgi:hypothetical protein
MIPTIAAILLSLFVLGVAFAVILEWRYPMREVPYEKFNSFIPVLLGSAACSFLGFIFYRRHFASSKLRTHEWYHWMRAKEMGRWTHLLEYIADFLTGLLQYGLKTVYVEQFGKKYLLAYWNHPEEELARAYETYAHPRPPLGNP